MSFISNLTVLVTGVSHWAGAAGFTTTHRPRSARVKTRVEAIHVMLASKDASLARKALVDCAGAAIVRCCPTLTGHKVTLEIHFPQGQGDAVIRRIISSLPHGEIGGVVACTSTCHTLHSVARCTEAHQGVTL